MNKLWSTFAMGLILIGGSAVGGPTQKAPQGTITVSGAWALYPMVLKWAEEFKKIHPRIRVDVQAGGAGKGMADVLSGMADLGMVSREVNPDEYKKGAFPVAVTKDGVVAAVSDRNPGLKDILSKGMTRARFIEIWITGKAVSWGQLLGTGERASVHVFTRSDACGAADTWAAYLGKRQEDLTGIGVYGDPGIADAVRRDPLGIGYNNVNFAYDAKTLRPVTGLAVVPIDLDESGKIEETERFYSRRDDLTRAIAENVYPSPPARELYLVAKGKPAKGGNAAEFLRWILTEGQRHVPETGYIPLSPERLREGLDRLK